MTLLPDIKLLKNSGLYGLEQYLVWALFELRRIAIQEEQQRVVRISFSTVETPTAKGSVLEGQLISEVSLSYDSDIALSYGMEILNAIQPVSDKQSALPFLVCSNTIAQYMAREIDQIINFRGVIDSLEKLLFWLCKSWVLTNSIGDNKGKNSFVFLEEQSGGAAVKFSLNIPLDYTEALQDNFLCAAYQSPHRSPLFYQFALLRRIKRNDGSQTDDSSMQTDNSSIGNNSIFSNENTLGN